MPRGVRSWSRAEDRGSLNDRISSDLRVELDGTREPSFGVEQKCLISFRLEQSHNLLERFAMELERHFLLERFGDQRVLVHLASRVP